MKIYRCGNCGYAETDSQRWPGRELPNLTHTCPNYDGGSREVITNSEHVPIEILNLDGLSENWKLYTDE